jgi:long-chain acyl-CoA synthetase
MSERDPVAAEIPDVPRTVAELPFFAAGRFPKPDLIGQCRGDQVIYTGGREFLDRVRDVSLGLTALGMTRGDRVALLSESRPEWLVVDFAILAARAVTVPIYTTLSAEQIGFILRDSGATMAIVSTPAQLAKVRQVAASTPDLRTIVVIDPDRETPEAGESAGVPVLRLSEVATKGHGAIRDGWGVARQFQETAKAIQLEDLATIIYTSGTTGEPKGVMLTHGNLIANLQGALAVLDLSDEDVALSFLPLCHAFERIVSYVYFSTGISMVFAESIDTIPRDLLTVRPTVMSGVPRVFEKLYARIHEKGRAEKGLKGRIFQWAMSIASARGEYIAAKRRLPWRLGVSSRLADRLIFSKIHAGLGGRLRYAVSGSAPLDPTVTRFFFGIDLPILEGYGLTETSPVLAVMPIGNVRLGTVGPPLSNVEIRIADDGEILARGPNVMRGYYNRADETAAVMSAGWFHTGDIGSLDEQGYLRITDRKKELLVTSGGKKIAPQPIEQRLRAHSLVAEAIMVGDRRHFPAALLLPDFAALGTLLGIEADAVRTQLDSSAVRALYQSVVDEVNRSLAQFERVKKFELVAEELTIANGALTPTLKVKRRVIEERFRDAIEAMYSGKDDVRRTEHEGRTPE